MKKIISFVLCIMLVFSCVSCGAAAGAQTNSAQPTAKAESTASTEASAETQPAESQTPAAIYAFQMEGGSGAYYVVDLDAQRVFMFYADADNDTCFALQIEEGDLENGLKGAVSDGYSLVPFTMQYKGENQTDRAIMTMEDAYEIELEAADLEEALRIMESKEVIELDQPKEADTQDEGDVYTAEGQVRHRDRIVGLEDRIEAVIEDVEMGSGKTIDHEQAALMEASLDVYSDSSRDIKSAYTDPDSPYRELMEALDEYLRSAVKWHGAVMRGAVATQEEAEEILSGAEPIDMQGPSSWTSDEVIAQHYACDKAAGDDTAVAIVYVLDENKSGASITHLSRYGTSEREVLAPSGVLYAVDFYETIPVDAADVLYIYVHEAE